MIYRNIFKIHIISQQILGIIWSLKINIHTSTFRLICLSNCKMSVQLSRRYAILGLSKLPRYVYKGHDLDGNKSSFARNTITYQVRKSLMVVVN